MLLLLDTHIANRNYCIKKIKRIVVWIHTEVSKPRGLCEVMGWEQPSLSGCMTYMATMHGVSVSLSPGYNNQTTPRINCLDAFWFAHSQWNRFRKLHTVGDNGHSQYPTYSKRCDIIVIDRVGTVAVHVSRVAIYIYRCINHYDFHFQCPWITRCL